MVYHYIRLKKKAEQDTGPQHCPKICKDRLYHSVHDLLPNACLFTIIPKESFVACEQKESLLPNIEHCSREPIAESDHLCESAGDDEFTYPIVDDVFDESSAPLSDEVFIFNFWLSQ